MDLPVVKRLKKDLQELLHELNVKLPKDLQEAAAHGDLSENAEYDAAKQRQEFVRARIAQIQGRIRELAMYTLASIPRDVIAYGTKVTVEDTDEGETVEYRLVFPEEADAASGAISMNSPIGRALLNKTEGDEIDVQTPGGRKRYQVVRLVTVHDLGDGGLPENDR
jgi:transcription elongation factor GreA